MEGHSERCICLLCVLRRATKPHKLVVPCKFNLLNSCKFSCDECRFTHYEYDEIPPCRHGVSCRFGPTKCLFLHDSYEGDGDAVEDLPQSNTEHAAEEQPAVIAKKKKRRNKKKKNKNKSRLVESKQDSQSSQNPYQPLAVEEIEATDTDSESEGELGNDSPLEAIQESSPLSNAVDAPSSVGKNSPFEIEMSKEVVENEIPVSRSIDDAQPVIEDAPDKSPEADDSEEEDSPYFVLTCNECDQDYPQFTYLNSLNKPSRHYALGSNCTDCGKALQKEPYWGHIQNRAGAMCKGKDFKYCLACYDNRLK